MNTHPRKRFRIWTKPRGSLLGYRLTMLVCRTFGFRAGRLLVAFCTFFYAIVARDARAGSLDYLSRLGLTRNSSLYNLFLVWKHFFSFGQVILDRLRLYELGPDVFRIRQAHSTELLRLRDSHSGCVIAGVHFGAFELASALFRKWNISMYIVMLNREKEHIRRFLDEKRLGKGIRILWVEDDDLTTALAIYQLLKRGHFVAMSVDRYLSKRNAVRVDFLGSPASFNLGVFMAAAMADVPVFTSFLVRELAGYRFISFPLLRIQAEGKGALVEASKRGLERYVGFLENIVASYPFQWYNFYLFWEKA
ncbi:MAG: hypothetical protein HY788_14690 [Deltaproteobacteria bacterium]|nr:hypothetical protein [Deltaproteobacteria bacterium]